MPPLTLNQAAKACGKSKSAILEAIRSGRLSADRDDKNQWQIDPAELFRVYPPDQTTDRTGEHDQPQGDHLENALLRQKSELLERMISALEDERDDLRRRLDVEAEERRRLTLMLTHQPEPQPANQNQPEPQRQPPTVRPWLWVALAAAIIVGGIALLMRQGGL